MLGFFRKFHRQKAEHKNQHLSHQYRVSYENVQPSIDNRTDLQVLRKRVAELTHKAMRGGLNEAERAQIIHEADLLWTRLVAETQQTRQPAKVS